MVLEGPLNFVVFVEIDNPLPHTCTHKLTDNDPSIVVGKTQKKISMGGGGLKEYKKLNVHSSPDLFSTYFLIFRGKGTTHVVVCTIYTVVYTYWLLCISYVPIPTTSIIKNKTIQYFNT